MLIYVCSSHVAPVMALIVAEINGFCASIDKFERSNLEMLVQTEFSDSLNSIQRPSEFRPECSILVNSITGTEFSGSLVNSI